MKQEKSSVKAKPLLRRPLDKYRLKQCIEVPENRQSILYRLKSLYIVELVKCPFSRTLFWIVGEGPEVVSFISHLDKSFIRGEMKDGCNSSLS